MDAIQHDRVQELGASRSSTRRALDELDEAYAADSESLSEEAARLAADRARSSYAADEAEREAAGYGRNSATYQTAQDQGRRARAQLAEIEARLVENEAEQKKARRAYDGTRSRLAGQLEEIDLELDRLRAAQDRERLERRARRADELEAQLADLAPLVEAQREAAGLSGIADLSEDYTRQAVGHHDEWKRWGWTLVGALLATAAVGIGLFLFNHPSEKTSTAEGISGAVFNIFILGLLLYGLRLTSLQFRVHRHLETVARNKAAALSTFNRIVSVASEAEVRAALATVLAQAVFSSDESGFIDGASDHVTLIERVAAPAVQRLTPP